eukprot:Nk52_evm55s210 gene=Nk52_evmTU55s210
MNKSRFQCLVLVTVALSLLLLFCSPAGVSARVLEYRDAKKGTADSTLSADEENTREEPAENDKLVSEGRDAYHQQNEEKSDNSNAATDEQSGATTEPSNAATDEQSGATTEPSNAATDEQSGATTEPSNAATDEQSGATTEPSNAATDEQSGATTEPSNAATDEQSGDTTEPSKDKGEGGSTDTQTATNDNIDAVILKHEECTNEENFLPGRESCNICPDILKKGSDDSDWRAPCCHANQILSQTLKGDVLTRRSDLERLNMYSQLYEDVVTKLSHVNSEIFGQDVADEGKDLLDESSGACLIAYLRHSMKVIEEEVKKLEKEMNIQKAKNEWLDEQANKIYRGYFDDLEEFLGRLSEGDKPKADLDSLLETTASLNAKISALDTKDTAMNNIPSSLEEHPAAFTDFTKQMMKENAQKASNILYTNALSHAKDTQVALGNNVEVLGAKIQQAEKGLDNTISEINAKQEELNTLKDNEAKEKKELESYQKFKDEHQNAMTKAKELETTLGNHHDRAIYFANIFDKIKKRLWIGKDEYKTIATVAEGLKTQSMKSPDDSTAQYFPKVMKYLDSEETPLKIGNLAKAYDDDIKDFAKSTEEAKSKEEGHTEEQTDNNQKTEEQTDNNQKTEEQTDNNQKTEEQTDNNQKTEEQTDNNQKTEEQTDNNQKTEEQTDNNQKSEEQTDNNQKSEEGPVPDMEKSSQNEHSSR